MREYTTDDLADEHAERQANRTGCRCSGDMPGYCPGPASCPMCETLDADEALNRNKVERADATAAYNQAMLNTLMRDSI